MSSIATSSEPVTTMPIPNTQDIFESPEASRNRWLEQASFALYEARRAELPEAYPLPWDQAPKAVRDDCRYRAKTAYRLGLPHAKDVLIEMIAAAYANLEGWIYPDCDNKAPWNVNEDDRGAFAAQRRQNFRHKASQLVRTFINYLEHDVDTEEQRRKSVARAGGQLMADQMMVSMWRSKRGMGEANHG